MLLRGTAVSLTIISSDERQTLAAIRDLNIEGLSVIDGIEPEIPGVVIHLDEDRAFSAFNDPGNSDSDYSDIEESEDSLAISAQHYSTVTLSIVRSFG